MNIQQLIGEVTNCGHYQQQTGRVAGQPVEEPDLL
jgi:hypothetical protein